ncbi:MAG: ribosomal protein S18-alanine N-acetyltransferase [candidate division Zixibacteria bacterium]|nr:ribosomal protein S18-alanine N-acetyltransferase [candidate division Zixibacteria bacterium]
MSRLKEIEIKYEIRELKSSDISDILAIESDSFPDPWPKSAFEEIIRQPGHGGLVVVSDLKLVAYACYLIIEHESHLTNLAVVHSFRRKSIASGLLERILDIVRKKGCEHILLEVRPQNKSAIAFYENAGFELLYSRPNYYRNPVEDAQVMVYYFNE